MTHPLIFYVVMPKRAGDTAVITGGSRGIGAEVVKQLMILDMHVIIGNNTTFYRKSIISLRALNI